MIETNLEKLHALARALLERESLDGEEIARILRAPPLHEAPSPAKRSTPANSGPAGAHCGDKLIVELSP